MFAFVVFYLQIVNTSAVPPEFYISETEGVIPARDSTMVHIEFRAGDPSVFEFPLQIEVSDPDGLSGAPQKHTVQVTAESYRIDVAVSVRPSSGHAGKRLMRC